ncbi:MAG: nucleotidyltransferase domain-containing protein [Candidatus Altiarchaeota archaeon]|nr:nucleotidyltransferase domain-containing protein [Candidatus Altiarchaeota archaeon]
MKPLDEIKNTLKEYKTELYKKYKIKKIEVFGSYVRNETKKESDIDLLVDFKEDADLIDLTGLALFLEEKLNTKVDIIPRRALRKELKESILKEATPI